MQKISLTQRFVERVKPTSTTQEYYDTKVSTLYLRIYPSGRRVFFVRFQHKGLRKNHKLGCTLDYSLRQARRKALLLVQQVRSQKKEILASITLQAFGQEFFKRYPRHWKPNTLKKKVPFVFRSPLTLDIGKYNPLLEVMLSSGLPS